MSQEHVRDEQMPAQEQRPSADAAVGAADAGEAAVPAAASAEETVRESATVQEGTGAYPAWNAREASGTAGDSFGDVPADATEGAADGALAWVGMLAPLVFALIVAAHAWYGLMSGAWLCPAEARYMGVFAAAVSGGGWLSPAVDGTALLPGFVWFAAACERLLAMVGLAGPVRTAALEAAAAGWLALLGVYAFSRLAGGSRRDGAAAALVASCAPLFIAFLHHAGPQALGTACVLFSLAFLAHGWHSEWSPSVIVGFVLAALAGVTQGILHLLLPLLASLVYLCWQGRPGRFHRSDAILGFALMLAVLAGWLAAVAMFGGAEGYAGYLAELLPRNPVPLGLEAFHPLLLAAVGLLPWLLVVLLVNWGRVVAGAPSDIVRSRRTGDGSAMCWIALVLGCGLGILMPDVAGTALLCCCLACPLAGKALLRLSGLGSKVFHLLALLLLVVVGLVAVAAGFGFSRDMLASLVHCDAVRPWLDVAGQLTWLPAVGGCLIVGALALGKVVDLRRPAGSLVACAVLVLLLTQPVSILLGPGLGAFSLSCTTTAPVETKQAPPIDAKEAVPAAVPTEANDAAPAAAPGESKDAAPAATPGETKDAVPPASPVETKDAAPAAVPAQTPTAPDGAAGTSGAEQVQPTPAASGEGDSAKPDAPPVQEKPAAAPSADPAKASPSDDDKAKAPAKDADTPKDAGKPKDADKPADAKPDPEADPTPLPGAVPDATVPGNVGEMPGKLKSAPSVDVFLGQGNR